MSETKYTFSDDRGEKLEHYGVKGMKWRHHKARPNIQNRGGMELISTLWEMSPASRVVTDLKHRGEALLGTFLSTGSVPNFSKKTSRNLRFTPWSGKLPPKGSSGGSKKKSKSSGSIRISRI